ncbi:hypothetical protein J3Q64DRAFT_1695978 [Phycomyces blakesleeanus]|uniref:Uncharacterized protein n=2 Tax=Phycomyces blakesleeanus TaxID=4837 RepID=A0A167R3C6_PHYB8|nr:hypothetical protein PHYBLDRAFT_184438 [Phycomyces blakesleeanus NRRL 1555(-)]OAD80754.1 hypothetical protein PHYBLDRAFT_184438 [Phycomyces blakesleeanus NRRL 1555(-)]|eukprot:XP_018298794.1 hypothetical protein PHYBLDRAFT_184438 [Phycomyces blakesleeanus NRRL 1555(-)]
MPTSKYILICILLAIAVPECYAPPVATNNPEQISNSAAYDILILLGYLTHLMTIRPVPRCEGEYSTFWRVPYFIYPTIGLGSALKAIVFGFYGDTILGIDKANKYIKKIDKKKRPLDKSLDERFLEFLASFRDKINIEAEKDYNYTHKPGDNLFYLAAILHLMKPRQARRVKHCILNSNIYLGLEATPKQINQYRQLILSEDMVVTGKGAGCTYQTDISPFYFCYLTEEMINQIPVARYLDNTSYTEICITIGQLVYTTISLCVLHKQLAAFSIPYDKDINIVIYEIGDLPSESDILNPDLYDKEDIIGIQTRIGNIRNRMPNSYYMSSHEDTSSNREEDTPPKNNGPPQENSKPPSILYEGSFLEKIIQKEKIIDNNEYKTYIEYHTYSYIISGCGGLTLSLLVGIWADYSAHSVTQWLVLTWILNQVLWMFLTGLKSTIPSYRKTKRSIILSCLIYTIGFIGAGCVFTAAVNGYVLYK